jgi:electron transfer flavoprotein alpha subunit
VVGGRGLQKEADLALVRELATLLGGDWAVTRPLVEKGWALNSRQIGLSGRTVRPKLILTCGVSGAIQFASCMNASEHIIAINTDPDAPIFNVAHVAIVGDLYCIITELIARLKEAKA